MARLGETKGRVVEMLVNDGVEVEMHGVEMKGLS